MRLPTTDSHNIQGWSDSSKPCQDLPSHVMDYNPPVVHVPAPFLQASPGCCVTHQSCNFSVAVLVLNMAAPLECSLCTNPFDFETEHRPMSLVCGHTYCRLCVSRLHSKTCPDCRAPFSEAATNYIMRNMMHGQIAAADSTSQEAQVSA